MNSRLIDKQEPRVADLFRRMEKLSKTLDKLDITTRRMFNGERFVTDRELSSILKISRRALQDYRSTGIIPYYMICGKALYKESEIEKLLEDARKSTLDEIQRW